MESEVKLAKEPAVRTIDAGNTIYRVFVQNIPGQSAGVGTYTATTGPDHPLGAGKNLLFGDGSPGTSFNTFRSYTTMTDYTVDDFSVAEPPFTKVNIREFGATFPLGTTGARTIYDLPGPPVTPDKLTIVQDVNVIGTTFEDSYVEVRVAITNNDNVDTTIGIRYLWDTLIGNDDGPTFQTINPISPLITNEAKFNQPEFEAFQMVDNDSNPNPPTYIVYGTVTGPIGVGTPPSRIQYANWFASRSRTFNYTINPNRNISSPPNNDSAVLYYWGHNEETAVSIDANGGSLTRVAALFSTRPGIVPPFINNNICIMANRIFDVCRQAVTRTKKQTIPSGILLGCKVKHAQCFVKRTNKGDNPGDIVQVKVVLRIAYMIDIQGKIMHVIRPFVFSAQARLLVPENATVDCEVLNTTCESTQLESSLVETTVQAFIQLQSKGTESIVIPFVASCPLRLCPTNTIGIAELNPGTGKDSLTWQDAGEDHNMEQDAGTEKDHNTEKDVDEDYNTE